MMTLHNSLGGGWHCRGRSRWSGAALLLAALAAATVVLRAAAPAAQGDRIGYTNDFSAVEVGKVPDDFLVLDGQFAVAGEGSEKYLELPGAPLETFGVMFGPSEKGNIAVSARIHGTAKGRRYPTFGVSVGGMSGYRVLVAPAKKSVELLKGDTVVASAPFEWVSGQWTRLRLAFERGAGSGWRAQAKVWIDSQPEPARWMVTAEDPADPVAGRCAVWGQPFSGTPIRFDDLRVQILEPASP